MEKDSAIFKIQYINRSISMSPETKRLLRLYDTSGIKIEELENTKKDFF